MTFAEVVCTVRGAVRTLALVCLAAGSAAAQQASTSLRITVVDTQQYPVPGATCVVERPGVATPLTAVTDAHGVAAFDAIPAAAVAVRVTLDGFEPFAKPDVVLVPHGTSELNVILSLARVAQSVTVTAETSQPSRDVAAGSAVPNGSIDRSLLQRLPLATARVEDALPVIAGVVKSLAGDLIMKGSGEQQSALLVNGLNAVDPGTGSFRLNLPVDAVEDVQVFLHPYSAEYGHFTGGLTTVVTRPGGDRWDFEVNDFLPDPRFIGGKLVGVAEDAPHLNFNGPLLKDRVFLSQSASYLVAKRQVRGLSYPDNETRTESQSYFTQLDIRSSSRHMETLTGGFFPQRDRYIGLDFFHPREATPNAGRRDLMLAARDTYQIGGGVLVSSVSWRTFATDVWGQGTTEQTVTPSGERGNYFATQNRRSARVQASEVYNLRTVHLFGLPQDFQIGVDVNDVVSRLDYVARPVNIVRGDGSLAERIVFDTAPRIGASNRTYAAFVQDKWRPLANLTIDFGVRYELQRLADGQVLAPRTGFAWAPKPGGATVIRGGIGVFYDKVPLNVRSFPQYPTRTVTRYAADGETVVDVRRLTQLLMDVKTRGSDDYVELPVPRNITWNLQVDRRVNSWVSLSANVIDSATNGRFVVNPETSPEGDPLLVLRPNGRSRYQALELAGRVGTAEHALTVSYTRSRARGDLNDVNSAYGDFGTPIIRANQFSLVSTDAPNRVIASGLIALPRKITLAPLVEAHSGFPYSIRDSAQYFIGARNPDHQRFPSYFSLDLELAKEFQVTAKYGVRLSVRGANLTDHFNPRNVRANIDDPQFGRFFASYPRHFSAGFDVMF
jgi:carboxypeptidase family protein/TonB-dependent receptor-like protein